MVTLTAHDVTAADGTRLRVWERSTDEVGAEAVLFLHGGITCSKALFAPPVPDDDSYSWLADAAARGRTAFAVDVRGYGESEGPPEMEEPPEANGPPVRARDAVADVRAAFEFVRGRFDVVHLVGVSWGTMTGGVFVAENDSDVASLTQCAPVYRAPYDFAEGMAAMGLDTDLDAYYVQERETVEQRQAGGVDDELFEAVWRTQVESGQGLEWKDAYVAQTGALADVRAACEDDPVYDAGEIDVPTLVIRGSDDATSQRSDALSLYDELDLAEAQREYAEIGSGGHFLVHGPRRGALYATVADFQGRS
ncbi:alpha/beta hydrolase [Halomicrococcus gelatinilyticus]|uniref:alpha/beta hydrolase n=1 Tax=Halomicrococcus gelatinilyticus TaxID=1702103 RepID=UPI002E1106F0